MAKCACSADSDNFEDPIAVAKRESERIRRNNRKTQLRDFVKPAQAIARELSKYVQSVQSQLGRFHLHDPGMSPPNHPFPANIDAIPEVHSSFHLNAEHHNQIRQVTYRLGSRGEQCVILRLELARDADSQSFYVQGNWQEVLWYEGMNQPDTGMIVRDFQRWLSKAIEDLSQQIAP